MIFIYLSTDFYFNQRNRHVQPSIRLHHSSIKARVYLKHAHRLTPAFPKPSCPYCHSVGLSTSISGRTAYRAADCPARYSLMDLSIHHLNPLATTTIKADTNAIWVGLNSDTSLILDSAIIFRNLPDPGWSVDDFSDSGQTLPFDNARDPDWYRFEEQWAPWTPTSFIAQQRPWYDLLETVVPVEERNGGWSMAEIQRQECSLDLTHVQSCIRYVVEFDQCVSRHTTVPGIFPNDCLSKVYPRLVATTFII